MTRLQKQWLNFGIAAIFPFIATWIVSILTGFHISAFKIFDHPAFWAVTGIYWVMILMCIEIFFEDDDVSD